MNVQALSRILMASSLVTVVGLEVVFLASPSLGQEISPGIPRIWTGKTSGAQTEAPWSEVGNWEPASIPTAYSDVTFGVEDAGRAGEAMVIEVGTAGASSHGMFKKLAFEGANSYTFASPVASAALKGGNEIILAGSGVVALDIRLLIGSKSPNVGPMVSGSGTLILNRPVTINSSTSLAGLQLMGSVKVFLNAEQLTREAKDAPIPWMLSEPDVVLGGRGRLITPLSVAAGGSTLKPGFSGSARADLGELTLEAGMKLDSSLKVVFGVSSGGADCLKVSGPVEIAGGAFLEISLEGIEESAGQAPKGAIVLIDASEATGEGVAKLAEAVRLAPVQKLPAHWVLDPTYGKHGVDTTGNRVSVRFR